MSLSLMIYSLSVLMKALAEAYWLVLQDMLANRLVTQTWKCTMLVMLNIELWSVYLRGAAW